MKVRTEGGFNRALERYDGIVTLVDEEHFETPEEYETWRDEAIASMERLAEIDLDEFDSFQSDALVALEKQEAQKDKVIAGVVKELESKDKEFQNERETLTRRIRKLEGQLSKKKTGGN